MVEAGVNDILKKTTDKDSRLMLGRLRTAWRLAQAEMGNALKKCEIGAEDEDLDLLLSLFDLAPMWLSR